MPTAPTPSEHHYDQHNEHALAYLAVHDWAAYHALDVELDDYAWPLARWVAEAAEAVALEVPSADRYERMARVSSRVRDAHPELDAETLHTVVSDASTFAWPDVSKLKRQRGLREITRALYAGLEAARAGDLGVASSALEEARDRAARRLGAGLRIHTPTSYFAEWLEQLRKLQSGGGISLGLPKLKELIGPLIGGEALVLGAGTGNGKSSVCLEIVRAAARDGTKSGLISMEDPDFRIEMRLIASLLEISPRAVKALHETDIARTYEALSQIGDAFRFVTMRGGTDRDVCAAMSALAAQGVRLIIVDYIGEVSSSTREQDRRNEIRMILNRLRQHALRLDVALIIVSQFSRPDNKDTAQKPTKHWLKEAGDLENAAEAVVLMWRDKEHDFAPVHFEMAKGKDGNTGKRWMMQREVYRETATGERVLGSARFREVVSHYGAHPGDRETPLECTDYEAILEVLSRR